MKLDPQGCLSTLSFRFTWGVWKQCNAAGWPQVGLYYLFAVQPLPPFIITPCEGFIGRQAKRQAELINSVWLVNLLMAWVFAHEKHHLCPFVSKLNFMLAWTDTLCPQRRKIRGFVQSRSLLCGICCMFVHCS